MSRRRLEPYTLALILLCVAWTAPSIWFGRSLEECGAATRHMLWRGEIWRIPATILLHGGWLHLLLNSLAILVLGPGLARSRAIGGIVFVLTVLFSALAGLAASLLLHEPNVSTVGISGGVMGLLGLILAIEWRFSQSVLGFLRQRNVVVVIVLLVANAILAIVIEAGNPGIRIDHAAHIGGLLFGLIANLAYFGPTGRRPLPGVAACLLLSLAPVAYASDPRWSLADIPYLRLYADRAHAEQDEAQERRLLDQILDLDKGHPIAAARLALLENDPRRLENVRAPLGLQETVPLVASYLELARRRLQSDPDKALALVKAASELPERRLGRDWLQLASQAEQVQRTPIALLAYGEAAQRLPESEAWRAAGHALALHRQRLAEPGLGPEQILLRAAAAAKDALRAAGGLAEDRIREQADRARYEEAVAEFATALAQVPAALGRLQPPPQGLRDLYGLLKQLFLRLADNSEGSENEARYLFDSATAWWREVEAPDLDAEILQDVSNRFRAALVEARRRSDRRLEQQIRDWYGRRHLPLPDLAGSSGGG